MACVDVSISPQILHGLIGSVRAPRLVDVRRAPAFEVAGRMIAGAVRRAPDRVEQWAATFTGCEVVVYCVHGHEVSQDAATALRALGLKARFLEGGIEAWLAAGLPVIDKDAALAAQAAGAWITRERPKIDRLACPWLVSRFIDPAARFLYRPTDQVLALAARGNAIAYDIPGGRFEHDGALCTFDTMLRHFRLNDPALAKVATIVRGADTARLDLAPEAAGLLAVSLGLGRLIADDQALLARTLPVYDALYAWARGPAESHNWVPAAAA